MKEILLTRGFSVVVDDWWYDYLIQWKWHVKKFAKTYCAARQETIGKKKQKTILMHRIIMNTPDDQEVDHRDHNGLNCLERNMRNCTSGQNSMNRQTWGRSKYLGVCYYKDRFRAQIQYNKQKISLGTHKTEEEAAHAYDKAAKELFGEFANLNFPMKLYA
jgi:hypothetical protein